MINLGEEELDLYSAIKKALKLVGKKGPITSLYKNPRYNDEPQFFQYTAAIRKNSSLSNTHDAENLAGGTAFSKEKAVMKALGEAIERYCLSIFKRKQLIYAPSKKLIKDYLDPSAVVSFSSAQLKDNNPKIFALKQDSKFWWVKGFSITDNKEILVPAQLVYVPYHTYDEPVIRLPVTTGASAGTSLEGAVIRGICEIVERDSFMIFYLNKLTAPKLDLSKTGDETLIQIRESFKRYNLNLFVFNISTDLPFTSIMAIIADKTGIGPAVSVGLKCSFSAKEAIIGAVEEAQQVRSWIRDEMHNQKNPIINPDHIVDLKDRGLYWSRLERIRDLDFFLNSKKIIFVDNFIEKSALSEFDTLMQRLSRKKLEVIFVDVTRPEVKKAGFFVVKVIIPQLQPLYLYENFKYLGGERLYNVPKALDYKNTPRNENELNSTPHPFL